MKRRDFIKLSANTALILAFAGLSSPVYGVGLTTTPKSVINLILDGGPDFRHLIVPTYSMDNNDANSYAYKFWEARGTIFGKSGADNLKQVYSDNYDDVIISGVACGILKKCAWLKDEINAGRVAIVNNVLGSDNRNHHHSSIMMEHGTLDANAHNLDVSGWVGRGAKALGENVVSVSREIRLSSNGPHPTNIKSHDNICVVVNSDSRNMGLSNYDTQADLDSDSPSYKWSEKAILSRSLSSYYSAKAPLVSTSSIFRKPIEHEKKLRYFSNLLRERLDLVPMPSALTSLNTKDDINELDSSYFARQILSLYDSYVSQDILDMRFASIEYTGWDSHKNLIDQIEPKLEDMFGTNKGFDTLTREIKALRSDSYDNSVIVISGEFGRQLKSNGDKGNDHGRGNSVIVIGGKVKGGFYGDPFPSSEIDNLTTKNKDIDGKTSMFRVYGAVLDWQQAGLGDKVFDNLSSQMLEDGVDLSGMFV